MHVITNLKQFNEDVAYILPRMDWHTEMYNRIKVILGKSVSNAFAALFAVFLRKNIREADYTIKKYLLDPDRMLIPKDKDEYKKSRIYHDNVLKACTKLSMIIKIFKHTDLFQHSTSFQKLLFDLENFSNNLNQYEKLLKSKIDKAIPPRTDGSFLKAVDMDKVWANRPRAYEYTI